MENKKNLETCKELKKEKPRCDLMCWSFDSEGNNYYDFGECGSIFKELVEKANLKGA